MDFTFYMPVRVLSGPGCVRAGGELLRGLGRRCLVMTGGRGAKESGALDDMLDTLKQAGVDATIFPGVGQNPLVSQCQQAAYAAEICRAEFVVGVGGVLIAGQPIAKPYLTGQPRLAQKLHGPVDGGLAKGRIFLADSVIDFFGRQVPAFIKEHFHDLLTLRRVTQPLVFQEGTKDLSGVAYWSVFTEHAPPRVGLQEWTIA